MKRRFKHNKRSDALTRMRFTILLATARAFFLKDSKNGLYLGQKMGNIGMVRNPTQASELHLQNTEPHSIATLLSLGIKALRASDGTDNLDTAEIDRSNNNQFFKMILTREGVYILQHKDRCVGYHCVFPGMESKDDIYKLGLVDCDNFANLITFTKTDKAYGIPVKKKSGTGIKPTLMKAEEVETPNMKRKGDKSFLRGLFRRRNRPTRV